MNNIKIENNAVAEINGVKEVIEFDDKNIVLLLDEYKLLINGEKLNMESLDTANGKAVFKGLVLSVKYMKKGVKPSGFIKKLFK